MIARLGPCGHTCVVLRPSTVDISHERKLPTLSFLRVPLLVYRGKMLVILGGVIVQSG